VTVNDVGLCLFFATLMPPLGIGYPF
jgi:hypothetical protein